MNDLNEFRFLGAEIICIYAEGTLIGNGATTRFPGPYKEGHMSTHVRSLLIKGHLLSYNFVARQWGIHLD